MKFDLRRFDRCLIEQLEPRLMLSASLRTAPTAGTLFVAGTQASDNIILSIDGTDHTKIDVNENGTVQQFNVADVHYIQIFGYDGNDYIKVDESNGKLPVGINVSGGKGNDTIIGSSLDDNIWGDQGNDSIFGYGGDDRLYGMKGNDDIWSGTGNDYVEGDSGNDDIQGSTGTGLFLGGKGNDDIYAVGGTIRSVGGKGVNQINNAAAQGITVPLVQNQLVSGVDGYGAIDTTTLPQTPDAYTPADIRAAYGYGGLASSVTGATQAMAIVIGYDDPTALADLQHFSTQFGITVPTTDTFHVVYANGVKPGTDPGSNGQGPFEAEFEDKLDTQWSHAIAPDATIYLVEAASSSDADLLHAIDVAGGTLVSNFGGGVVNMSFGGSESSDDPSFEAVFKKYAHVSFVASSGDTGAELEYPASSPEVLAVGGTTLELDSGNNVTSETAWGTAKDADGGGGGVSAEFNTPAYQLGLTVAGAPIGSNRVVPDVSYDADPDPGYDVYTSLDLGNGPVEGWLYVGGTSAGAPNWTGLLTLANQIRTQAGLGYLGNAATAKIYSLATDSYSTYFNDITGGTTGFAATTGFDLATGFGTPKATALVNALADGASTSVGDVDFNWNAEYLEAVSKYPGGVTGSLAATFNGTGTAVLGLTVVNLNFEVVNQYSGQLLDITATNLTRTSDNHVFGDGTAIVEGPLTGQFYSRLFGNPVEFSGGITFDSNGVAQIKGTWRGLTQLGTVPVQGLDEQFTGGFSSY